MEALLFPLTNVYAATLLPLALAFFPPALASPEETWASFAWMGLVPCAFFYAGSLVYFCLDTFTPPQWRARHKFQGPRGVVAAGSYAAAFWVSLRSWGVGLCYILFLARTVGPWLGAPPASAPWHVLDFLCHSPVYLLSVDLCFFATHRLLHTRPFFVPVHKFHHTFSAPFAIAAVYAHPFEHLFSNVLSISLGPLLMRSHPISAALWGCLAAFSTLNSHSGFRFSMTSDGHDWHHRESREMYGAGLALLDRLLGTDALYRQHQRKQAELAAAEQKASSRVK